MTDAATNTQDSITFAQVAAREALMSAPPLAAWALTPNTLVAILTSVYIAAQLAYLFRKWWREERQKPPARDDA